MGRVGFCGLGQMGAGMVRSLLRAGHEVSIWNRTADKVEPLVDAAATRAVTPAEAAHGADVCFSMVADDAVRDRSRKPA